MSFQSVDEIINFYRKELDKLEKDDMDLPEGRVCSDCLHWRRCSSLIDDLEGTETRCDFGPSRFKEKLEV